MHAWWLGGLVAWSLGVTYCVTVVILVTLHKYRVVKVVAKSLCALYLPKTDFYIIEFIFHI